MAVVVYVGLLLTGLIFLAVFVITDDRAYRREVKRANAEGRGWKLVECPDEVVNDG
jgi:hypothetical protein